jgi:hypothetical protein
MLALFLEVWPTEIGFLTAFALHRQVGMYVVTKLASLILILLPLGIYFYIRRATAPDERPTIWNWQLMSIVIIMLVNVGVNSVVIGRWWATGGWGR